MEQKLKLELIKKFLNKEREEGFSLLELVVVVAVLAVLSAIALPSFQSMRIRLDETEAKALAHSMMKSMAVFNVEEGKMPTAWKELSDKYFSALNYCVYDQAINRACGTAVGIPVSSIDAEINPLNCVVVTQASYEMCGRVSDSQFQMILREMTAIKSPSKRKSISACYSPANGGRVIKQSSRSEVWISCL
tara:strand:- start:917 stop:1489 length:573 start_codon:yes stop_codon:yes gene_type:complete